MRLAVYVAIFACACWAQGTIPKSAASKYRVQVSGASADYGVEYQVRTVSAGRDSFLVQDYLVVEIAIFPKGKREVQIDLRNFTLRLNGKSGGLLAQTPGMVAASLKYPDWERRKELTAVAGAGDRAVIVGRQAQVERFPGDPRPAQRRLPRIPAEGAGDPRESPDDEREDPASIVQNLSLPEGASKQPVSGYIFFPFRGRLGKIEQVTLLITETDGQQPLAARLR